VELLFMTLFFRDTKKALLLAIATWSASLSLAHAQFEKPTAAPRPVQELAKREEEIKKLQIEGNTAEADRLLMELAAIYLEENKLQEAVWSMRRAGHYEEARMLTEKIKNHLLTAPILKTHPAPQSGASKPWLFEMPGGVFAVGKVETGANSWAHSNNNEALAFEVADALGFNLVPVTVVRNWNGAPASLQLFIKDAASGGVSLRDNGYTKATRKIYLLDFILGNTDRNHLNWLIRPGSQIVAIDHGLIYKPGKFSYSGFLAEFDTSLLPKDKRLLNKITSVTDEELVERIKPYASQEQIDFILKRRKIIADAAQMVLQMERLRAEIKNSGTATEYIEKTRRFLDEKKLSPTELTKIALKNSEQFFSLNPTLQQIRAFTESSLDSGAAVSAFLSKALESGLVRTPQEFLILFEVKTADGSPFKEGVKTSINANFEGFNALKPSLAELRAMEENLVSLGLADRAIELRTAYVLDSQSSDELIHNFSVFGDQKDWPLKQREQIHHKFLFLLNKENKTLPREILASDLMASLQSKAFILSYSDLFLAHGLSAQDMKDLLFEAADQSFRNGAWDSHKVVFLNVFIKLAAEFSTEEVNKLLSLKWSRHEYVLILSAAGPTRVNLEDLKQLAIPKNLRSSMEVKLIIDRARYELRRRSEPFLRRTGHRCGDLLRLATGF